MHGWNAAPYSKGGRKGKSKWQQHSWDQPWHNNSWGYGYSSKGRGAAARSKLRGEFLWSDIVALETDPIVNCSATYSYVSKTPENIDVLCPAWPVRRMKKCQADQLIDLSLERCLLTLQDMDGGFDPSPALASVLGLGSPASFLALAHQPDAQAAVAIMVLKTIRHYKSDAITSSLAQICNGCEQVACETFGLSSSDLIFALDHVNEMTEESCSLPSGLQLALRENFAASGRWSFFELWGRLLPAATMTSLRKEGAVLCPRFFLVDLASAQSSPYDIDKTFLMVRHGACVFVGQPPEDDGGGGPRDGMRQGRHLEGELINFSCVEEDHVLTEVVLPGARAIFSAAPDAVENYGEEELTPFDEDDTGAWESAGYSFEAAFPVKSGKHEQCRVWAANWDPAPPESYIEVKKTTHLNGRPGQFKLLKFWLQAALMRCESVVVATTEGSKDGDSVTNVQRFSVEQLAAKIDVKRIWASLASMLQYVLEETSGSEGAWTLKVQKARGTYELVKLSVCQGWPNLVDGEISETIMERASAFFDGQEDIDVVPDDDLTAYA